MALAPAVAFLWGMRGWLRAVRAFDELGRRVFTEAAAIALGVSRQTVNAVETGRYDPSLPLAFALARVFHRRIEELFETDVGDDVPMSIREAG